MRTNKKMLYTLINNIYPPVKTQYYDPDTLKFNNKKCYYIRIDKDRTDYVDLLELDKSKYVLYLRPDDLTKNEIVIEADYLSYLYNVYIKYDKNIFNHTKEHLESRLERTY